MQNQVQQYLLDYIKSILPAHISIIEVLMDVLNLSQDSAYRRLRCETALTLEEGVKLCQHFEIAVDSLLNNGTESVVFQYFRFRDKESLTRYLETIYKKLQQISNNANGQVICADDDMPILHHFRYPEQAAFKIYYWIQSAMHDSTLAKSPFDMEWVGKDLLDLTRKIYDLYCQIPSIEIWTEDCAVSTLKQILYCWEARLFNSVEEAHLVCDQFIKIFDTVQHQAEKGTKNTQTPNFQLYYSEIQVDNNCIWAQSGRKQETFIRHQTFNIVHTEAEAFCKDTEEFLHTLIKKSILISGSSERHRNRFFEQVRERIKDVKRKLQ